ncbi:hypothetical protein B7486_54680, partial [cyanobacterium TDX16]
MIAVVRVPRFDTRAVGPPLDLPSAARDRDRSSIDPTVRGTTLSEQAAPEAPVAPGPETPDPSTAPAGGTATALAERTEPLPMGTFD